MLNWLSRNLWSPSTPPPDSRPRDAQLHQTPTRRSDPSRVQSRKVQVVTPPRRNNPATSYPSPTPTPRRVKKESHIGSNEHPIYPSLDGLELPSVPTTPPGHSGTDPGSDAFARLAKLQVPRNEVDSVQNRLPSPPSYTPKPSFSLPTPPPSSSRSRQVLQANIDTPTKRPPSSRKIAAISSLDLSPRLVTIPSTPSPPAIRPREAARSELSSGPRTLQPVAGQQPRQQRNAGASPAPPTPENKDSGKAFKMRQRLLATGEFENGEKLTEYQLADLRCLVEREAGAEVCDTEVVNSTGFLLAYDMGLGKTVISIALIICNPPPKKYKGARATLVIVSNQAMMCQWKTEAQKFDPNLRVCFYNSVSSPLDPDADVVLMTYTQLYLQHGAFEQNPEDALAPIFRQSWYRQILDEAQFICNPETKTAKAVLATAKRHGLCLTGTPVQNTLVDLYSIFKFLGVTYEGIDILRVFERKIYSRKQKGRIINERAKELLALVLTIVCILRKKGDINPRTGRPLVQLPLRTDSIIEVYMTLPERQIYAYVKNLPLHIFALYMRLRQVCDHPALLQHRLEAAVEPYDIEEADQSSLSIIMGSDPIVAKNLPSTVRPLLLDSFMSSKLKAMLRILNRHKGQKTIVFTHFTSFIPAIMEALVSANICWIEYTGDMSLQDRTHALRQIAEDKECAVIIVSIRAGGVGLNITSCNNVILMEPWWNPYVEEQAISRVHRIGQTLPVNVYRLVVQNSIEEAILETQQLKREMGKDVYGDPDQSSFGKLDEATQRAWLEGP